MQATDEQVDAEFDRLLEEGTLEEEQHAEFKADGRRRLQVANALIQQRLHDFLFSHNTINEAKQSTMPDPEEMEELEEEAEAVSGDGLNIAPVTSLPPKAAKSAAD